MIKQYWNPRSKKWVKIDTSKKGGIIDMKDQKFKDIPETETDEPDAKEGESLDSSEDSEGGFFGW